MGAGTLQSHLLVALVMLLGLAAAGLFVSFRRLLVMQFDAGLETRARLLSAMIKDDLGEGLETEIDEVLIPEYQPSAAPEYFELRLADGTPYRRSASLGTDRLPDPPAGGGALSCWDLRLPDGRAGRAVAFRFAPAVEGEGERRTGVAHRELTIIAARDRGSLDRALRAATMAIVAFGIPLLLAIPAIVLWAVQGGLRSLEGLAVQAAAIDARRLDARFTAPGLPAELEPVAARLDDLLDRLSASFERERRFSADVAHELRTPLAELRTIAAVFPATASPVEEATAALCDVDASAAQMEHIVTTLLALARCDGGRQPINRVPVDMDRALADAWPLLEKAAQGKRLVVDFELRPAPPTVETDPILLASILGNLLSNAVEYTPEGGRVRATFTTSGDRVLLRLTNSQQTLVPRDLPRLFDPFWRKDQARTGGIHTGLGLALVAALARVLDGEVTVTLPAPDLVSFALALPLRAPAVPPERP
jgi:signal transduction histidine kinase